MKAGVIDPAKVVRSARRTPRRSPAPAATEALVSEFRREEGLAADAGQRRDGGYRVRSTWKVQAGPSAGLFTGAYRVGRSGLTEQRRGHPAKTTYAMDRLMSWCLSSANLLAMRRQKSSQESPSHARRHCSVYGKCDVLSVPRSGSFMS